MSEQRGFLERLTATAPQAGSQSREGPTVRIGVVGTGWWATQFHLPGLLADPRVEVVALADPDEDRLAGAAERFAVEACYPGAAELVARSDVDGVVIATPHAYHHEAAAAALRAGVSVLVEKPMTLVGDDAWDLIALARQHGAHLVVGYTYQFTRHAARVREVIRSGAIGEIRLISAVFASMVESYLRGSPEDYRAVFDFPVTPPSVSTYADPKLAGGGQAQSQVTHTLGMMLWATGLRPAAVYAQMASFDLDVDLVDALTFRLDNGAIGTIASTGAMRPGQPQPHEIRYFGSEGMVFQDLNGGHLQIHRNDGSTEVVDDLADDEVYPVHAPARCLVDLLCGQDRNDGPGEPAAATVDFLDAAYRSAATGGPVTVEVRS